MKEHGLIFTKHNWILARFGNLNERVANLSKSTQFIGAIGCQLLNKLFLNCLIWNSANKFDNGNKRWRFLGTEKMKMRIWGVISE